MRAQQLLLRPPPAAHVRVLRMQVSLQPYTAQFKIITVPPDDKTGLKLSRTSTGARDSIGRTVILLTTTSSGWKQPYTQVTEDDPVRGLHVNWSPGGKEVDFMDGGWQGCRQRVLGMKIMSNTAAPAPAKSPGGCNASLNAAAAPVASVSRADLGVSTIAGVKVHGQRTTDHVGKIANEQPNVITLETWTAPSLDLALRRTVDNPCMGKTTRELVSLKLGEPDPALFQIQPDYTVYTWVPCNKC